MNIFVTGGTGFVGRALLRRLSERPDYRMRIALRRPSADVPSGVVAVPVGDFDSSLNCASALDACEVVVHLAARVHVMQDSSADPLTAFRRVNVGGTLALARQAAAVGVRQFIFLSSIKVNGEQTSIGQPFTVADTAKPVDPYGISKLEAEQGLMEISRASGMEVTVIRCPLVYGPGVRANFLQMMRWVYKGIPLPFGAVTGNRRSLIALDNLVDLVTTCIERASTRSQVLLASDGEDLSTADLLQRLGRALGRSARLIAVPPVLLRVMGQLTGHSDQMLRLLGSLQIDCAGTRRQLGWNPPLSVDTGLQSTAAHFLREMGR